MTKEDLKNRTKEFALRIIKMTNNLPASKLSQIIEDQIIRSSTSVGANYRAACRAKSTADFINKLKIVEEELDETLYWIELIEDSGLIESKLLQNLKSDGNELLSIIVSSIITARKNK